LQLTTTDPNEEIETTDPEIYAKRSGCLTLFLGFMVILNAFAALSGILLPFIGDESDLDIPTWASLVLGLLATINTVAAIAVIKWKKIGVYVLIGSATVTSVINYTITDDPLLSSIGLLGPIILVLLLIPVWKHLK
jgi:hypothetical protein